MQNQSAGNVTDSILCHDSYNRVEFISFLCFCHITFYTEVLLFVYGIAQFRCENRVERGYYALRFVALEIVQTLIDFD